MSHEFRRPNRQTFTGRPGADQCSNPKDLLPGRSSAVSGRGLDDGVITFRPQLFDPSIDSHFVGRYIHVTHDYPAIRHPPPPAWSPPVTMSSTPLQTVTIHALLTLTIC